MELRQEAKAGIDIADQMVKDTRPGQMLNWSKRDKVWLDGKNLWLRYPNIKLAPKRLGPFSITDVISCLDFTD